MPLLSKISSYFKQPTTGASPAQAATARHILDFSEHRCRLREENCQIVVERDGETPVLVPFADIAVVIIANAGVTLSQSVLENLATFGAMLVVCDYKYLPVSMMMPMAPYASAPLERLQLQIEASQPLRKQAWQQVVKAKIQAQARLLLAMHDDDAGLMKMAESVRSGDPENVESQAAKKYWAALFPKINFHRERSNGDPINARLNYGYTVLRAITARAVCATGFHPALGIHHCSIKDAFCLADDLMEPFRPFVDAAVYVQYKASYHCKSQKLTLTLSPHIKKQLISSLSMRFRGAGESRKLFDHIAKLALSLVRLYEKEQDTLYLPVLERISNDENV